jgi:Asp-tRNA(Asn)/Glu-tRNA(Gln) amidotransferase A subunit family amidase
VTYDLRSVSLPKLGSGGLRALIALVETPGIGPLLIEKLRRDAGINALRSVNLSEPPTFLPAHASEDPGIPALEPFDANDSPYADQPAAPPEPRGFQCPSVGDFGKAYRTGRATPDSIAAAFLAQWRASDAGNRPLHAFIAVREDDLRAQAAASSARWAAGRPLGAWDGVPVAIKDEFNVAGYPLTVGTRVLAGTPAAADATIVTRLRAAGALIVGKANMHEIGINITGLNPHYGTTRNPYDDAYHTGGSSSGSATAVASGLVPVAMGADGGGSIRIPSSFCGLVGIKPTFGRVSEHGAAALVWSVAFAGPIAGSVRDCAAAYALVAGDDSLDPNSRAHPSVSLDVTVPGSLKGVRIGVYREWFRHASADVVARNEELLSQFSQRGAEIVDVAIPELDLQRVAHVSCILGEMAAAMSAVFPSRRSEFGLDARVNLAMARSVSGAEVINAARMRTRAMAHWRAAFRDVHVIATPATGQVAPRIEPSMIPRGGSDLSMTTEVMRFAFPANLTGHPAISFPAGYDRAGLPVGMQVIGRPWSERLLFRIASMAELIVERRAPKRWHPTFPSEN